MESEFTAQEMQDRALALARESDDLAADIAERAPLEAAKLRDAAEAARAAARELGATAGHYSARLRLWRAATTRRRSSHSASATATAYVGCLSSEWRPRSYRLVVLGSACPAAS